MILTSSGACSLIPPISQPKNSCLVDPADLVAGDLAERAPHVPHDAVLAAVVDHIVPHDMRPDGVFAPSELKGFHHGFELARVTRFPPGLREMIIARPFVFSEAYRGAFRIVDVVVFDDPAFAPVRTDQTGLVAGRRRERCRGVRQLEPGDRDVVLPALFRIEHAFPHVDLDQFGIRIRAVEIRPDAGVGRIDLRIPLVDRVVRVQNRLAVCLPRIVVAGQAFLRLRDLLHGSCLEKRFAVQIDFPEVQCGIHGRHHPVAVQPCVEGIEIPEQRIRDHGLPYRAFPFPDPSGDPFRTFEHDMLVFGGDIGDALPVGCPARLRIDPFAVFACMDDHSVARHRQIRRALDRRERQILRSGVAVRS